MCGIAGFWDRRQRAGKQELEATALRMAAAMWHRGPDDQGAWSDATAGLGLGHRRLAILDLSHEGHQPMHSADARYVTVFNGEIYNFEALRNELIQKGHEFRGHSDTEVILAAFRQWGIAAGLQRCIGMFALAVWDRHERILHLARDRAGEKPLYYGWNGDVFLFGSELKTLRSHPRWSGTIDRHAVALLTRFGYIPAPWSIYENISKLPPGCLLALTENELRDRHAPQPEPYWTLAGVAEAGLTRRFKGDESDAIEHARRLLLDSVRQQMVADVPLGAFLSGGIDSSLVVALMQAQSARPIKTFSIGFRQSLFDEAPHAKAVARHLGTDHTELYVTPAELREVITRLPSIYDEPFADSSQIPTVLLCQLARSRVTVSLSGDAGDELFGGYDAYRRTQRVWPVINRIPRPLRHGAAIALKSSASWGLNLGFRPRAVHRVLGRALNLSQLLPASDDLSLYELMMSPNREPVAWLRAREEASNRFREGANWPHLPELLQRMMYLDFVSYLPDDILVKVDRAAMSVSLETRIPLLDHRVVEYAWSLPSSLKQRQGRGKWLLRQVLHTYVPASLVDRPKKGFNVPLGEWLRGPLRYWAEDLLSEARLRQDGFFDEQTIRRIWGWHLCGKREAEASLWHVLMFQAWLDQERGSSPSPAPMNPALARPAPLVETCPS